MEKILFAIEQRPIFNIYSDLEQEYVININAYSLKEMLIEKMTALMGNLKS